MKFQSAVVAALGVLLLSVPAAAQSLGAADGRDLPGTDVDRVQVGSAAPDFTLPRFQGEPVRLSQFRGRSNVVLVFYRGYWCAYCIRQLQDMRNLLDDELKGDTELLVVSVDAERETGMSVTRIAREDGRAPDFGFLMDTDHSVIARYGILNASGTRRGIPHPATYVIDKQGVVRWKDVQTDYRIRPANADIVRALKQLR